MLSVSFGLRRNHVLYHSDYDHLYAITIIVLIKSCLHSSIKFLVISTTLLHLFLFSKNHTKINKSKSTII